MSTLPQYIVLGAGVIGLTTALHLHTQYPTAHIKVLAKHQPGDSSLEYCSPWAGANWLSFATDGGRQEEWDRITFEKFTTFCGDEGKNEQCGIWKMDIEAYFDNDIEGSGTLSADGEIWYKDLVRNFRMIEQENVPVGAKWGFECGTFVVDTGKYLSW